jgi:hypothetical protein
MALRALKGRPTRTSFERTLRIIGAPWYEGETFTAGQSYPGDGLAVKCETFCDTRLQVTFTHTIGLCVVFGDVLTVYFDKNQRFDRFRIDSAADGC